MTGSIPPTDRAHAPHTGRLDGRSRCARFALAGLVLSVSLSARSTATQALERVDAEAFHELEFAFPIDLTEDIHHRMAAKIFLPDREPLPPAEMLRALERRDLPRGLPLEARPFLELRVLLDRLHRNVHGADGSAVIDPDALGSDQQDLLNQLGYGGQDE